MASVVTSSYGKVKSNVINSRPKILSTHLMGLGGRGGKDRERQMEK